MLWLLALVPLLAGAVALAGGGRSRLWLGALAVAALLLTLALSIAGAAQGWSGTLAWSGALRLQAALTPLSATVAMLVPAIALPVLAFAAAEERRAGLPRLVALLLAFVGGMELLVVADDLLTLLIGWELVGACSWALIGHDWRDARNPRSGLYAFVTTRFGDLGLFLAAMATYAATGSFAYDGLRGLPEPMLSVIAAGILLSAAAKSGQLPFSPWLFRAMDGPTPVSALLHAATMVAAGAYLLARLQPMLGGAGWFAAAIIAIGLATALAGGVVALLQSHAKKLLAASTSAHFGLMFVAVGAGFPGIAILHLVAHAGFKASLFLAAGLAGARAGSFALYRMRLGRALPAIALLSAVAALALAGIPPLGAAWTKEAVIAAAGERGALLAAGCMVAGGLSAAYAARFLLLAYGPAGDAGPGGRPAIVPCAALGGLAAFSLLLSLLWLPGAREAAARALAAAIPPSGTVELVASLLSVALGVLVGLLLARRYPAIGLEGRSRAAAAWLGLPSLISAGAVRPFERAAGAAAWVDDRILDAGPRGAACLAQGMTRSLALLDRRAVEGSVAVVPAFAAWLALLDRRAVDGGIAGTAAFADWLARLGERLADGLPEGAAAIAGMSGHDARRLQSGMSHHYYTLMAIGAAAMAAALFLEA
ncbi:MAG: proton-conducting transporter membrane subunit [Sneathiellaceae bacterium]